MRTIWHSLAAVAALVPSACSAGDALQVTRDDEPWPYTSLRAELVRTSRGLELVLAPRDDGEPGTADGDLTHELAVSLDAALSEGDLPRAFVIEGMAVFPYVEDAPWRLREEPTEFAPAPSNDPAIARAFITDHCFCTGDPADVRQEIAGELVLDGFSADGSLRGSVDVLAAPLPNGGSRVWMGGPFTAISIE